MEKVVFDNFFHFFHELLRKSLESYKWWKKLSKTTFSTIFVKKNFLRNSWKKSKKLSKTTYSTTQAVLEAQIVEKVVFDNFFHHFYGSKDFLNNSWNKCKKLSKPIFSTTQAVLGAEIVE